MSVGRVKNITFVVLAILILAGSALLYRFWLEAGPLLNPSRQVQVRAGEGLRAIALELQAQRVVRSALAFEIFARASGLGRHLQVGEYRFAGGETVAQVLGHLARGEAVYITITVPEGATVHQIAERLDEAGLVCDWRFEQAARNSPLIRALGLTPLGAEGYLFPATYRFAPGATVERILATMLARFYAVLTPQIEARITELGLTTKQLITLASMVEKEAKVPAERPLIAGVFYNRLRLHMPLQSDPTAEYGNPGVPEQAVTAVHTPSAYNTYTIAGLPPGPIANPGMASIEAALYPTPSDYLYFVARKDGTHIFSRSLKQHDRAIESLRRQVVPTAIESRPAAR